VEVSKPISDIDVPQIFDRLCCTIELEGVELGTLELPVCNGMVAGVVLADAIAVKFAWQILDRFFQQNPETPQFNWTLFLQEIWHRPHWIDAYFYNPETTDEAQTIILDRDFIAVEVSEDLPNIKVELSEIDVPIKVGGVAVGIVTVAVENNFVSSQKLRSTITQNSGFELCVAAVREALVGKSLNGEMSLRSRLASSAQEKANFPDWLNAPGSGGLYTQNAVIFGRREGAMGTSTSRRAALPAMALRELAEAVAMAGESITPIPLENNLPQQVFYAPEIIWRKSPYREVAKSVQPQFFDNNTVTDKLPILTYRRISPDGVNAVNPEIFAVQLEQMQKNGYYSTSWESWQTAQLTKTPLPGKAILLTFDGGYLDFIEYALPLLKRFDFTATIFLVAESVGKTNSWEKAESEAVQLMGWSEIRQLRDQGFEFGSMSATYQPLTSLSPTEIVREGAKSRAILERGLGKPVKCFAYPYGSVDRIVEHLMGAIGYTFGVSYGSEFSNFDDSLLSLPRIQVTAENAFDSLRLIVDN
jgi:peptidoglycan/xylan/chitin deacetylase (PgdA/CDA1 family)